MRKTLETLWYTVALPVFSMPVVILLAAVIFVSIFSLLIPPGDFAGHYYVEVSSPKGSLFIRGIATGITRDNQVWWITTRLSAEQPDTNSDYEWDGLQPFFYKFQGDTLFLLVRREQPRPASFHSGLEVHQQLIDWKQFDFMFAKHDSLGWNLAQM